MNKKFIPKDFNERKEKENTNSIKRGVFLILIGNLIIFPINIGYFNNDAEKVEMIDESEEKKSDINYKKDILRWINTIDKYSNLATVSENKGELLLKDENKLKDIKNEINVVKISKKVNDYYINVVGE